MRFQRRTATVDPAEGAKRARLCRCGLHVEAAVIRLARRLPVEPDASAVEHGREGNEFNREVSRVEGAGR